MKVHVYEKVWLAIGALMIVGFLLTIVVSAGSHAVHPPSHMETIDPTTVKSEGEFARPGVTTGSDGETVVIAVAEMYVFSPQVIRVPAGQPITFRMTSPDVLHGFQIIDTNVNAMIIPGYVTQFTATFPKPGEYLAVCNEYCGLSHHLMHARLLVEEAP